MGRRRQFEATGVQNLGERFDDELQIFRTEHGGAGQDADFTDDWKAGLRSGPR